MLKQEFLRKINTSPDNTDVWVKGSSGHYYLIRFVKYVRPKKGEHLGSIEISIKDED